MSGSAECALCRPDLGPAVAESLHWRVAVDRNQNLLGKVMIVCRRHVAPVVDLAAEEWRDLRAVLRQVHAALTARLRPVHLNYACRPKDLRSAASAPGGGGGCPSPRAWPSSGGTWRSGSRPTRATCRPWRRSQGEAVAALDGLCRSAVRRGRRVARFQPATHATCALFAAVLAGDHVLHGFRNRHLCARLHPRPPRSPQETKRRCARVRRLIAQLRGHGLITKVRGTRLYRPTRHGLRVMVAALHARQVAFPEGFRLVA